MCAAFKVAVLDDIPGRLRAETDGQEGCYLVALVRHEPLRKESVVEPRDLPAYLQWWDEVFLPCLGAPQAFALLGISFIVESPPKFLKVLRKYRLDAPEGLQRIVFNALDELDKLARKDLVDFLRTHRVVLPRDHKDRILDEILERTGGEYDLTLEELRRLVRRALDERRAEDTSAEGEPNTSEDDDW